VEVEKPEEIIDEIASRLDKVHGKFVETKEGARHS